MNPLSPGASPNRSLPMILSLGLILGILVVYAQVRTHQFISYDDYLHILSNPNVRSGLSWDNVIWAFSRADISYWVPLVWISHMLDVTLYGLSAGGHHVTNLLWHIVNTLILFAVFRKMTGKIWESGLLAALFAIHPVHVESVAWVSERKDVLSGFFGLLTLYGYRGYVQNQTAGRYLLVTVCFILGLMAKPMVVTLPCVLLLLDYWPLKRFQQIRRPSGYGYLIAEKGPLLIFSIAVALITIRAQKSVGTLSDLELVPLPMRIENALVSYVRYMGKLIWPSNLSVYYPYLGEIPAWQVGLCVGVLITISVAVVIYARKSPWMVVGWLWFLGTMLPVIGIVQVGSQPMADRYMYLPAIGLYIIIAWTIGGICRKWPRTRRWVVLTVGLALAVLMGKSWVQTSYWANSIRLYSHCVNVTSNNYMMHSMLGTSLMSAGQYDAAEIQFQKAIQIHPYFAEGHLKLGDVYAAKGKVDQALKHFQLALGIDPHFVEARISLGNLFLTQSRLDEAMAQYQKAIEIQPNAEALNNLGIGLLIQGDIDGAIDQFQTALQLNPGFASARRSLEKSVQVRNAIHSAAIQMKTALQNLDSTMPDIAGIVHQLNEAKTQLLKAVDAYQGPLTQLPGFHAIYPADMPLLRQLWADYASRLDQFTTIAKNHPQIQPDIWYHMACMYAIRKDKANAAAYLKQALEHGFNHPQLLSFDLDLKWVQTSNSEDTNTNDGATNDLMPQSGNASILVQPIYANKELCRHV